MPIHPTRYQEVFRYLNELSPVSEKTWLVVSDLMEEVSFGKHEFFAKEGRFERKAGIILEGVFRSFVHTENGGEFTKTLYTPIHYKTPISYLGAYTSLVTGGLNEINVQALTPARVLSCSYEEMISLGKHNHEVATWNARLANLFFMGKEKREIQLSTLTAEQRYLRFLAEFPELESQINQYYIAQFLGITPTQLSRVRKKHITQ